MRRSREEAAETRRRIVATASGLFRRRGAGGIGVAELMAEAGLTHGGFYKHFASKDALVAEACQLALAQSTGELGRTLAQAPAGGRLRALADAYLTRWHRDHPEHGCAIAALGAEAARGEPPARQALTHGLEQLIALAEAELPQGRGERPRERALTIVAALLGALIAARLVSDPALSDEMLRAVRQRIGAGAV
jgi:TetR/AcrR family transcriptional repressor of nem operon